MNAHTQLILAYSSIVIILLSIVAITNKYNNHRHIVFWSIAVMLIIFSFSTYTRLLIIPFNADEIRRDFLLTGDEPAYFMTAVSIAKDGDLNLANNVENKDYLLFQKRPYLGYDFQFFNSLAQNRLTSKYEEWGNARYMRHRPGTSFLLSPAFMLADHNQRFWAYTIISFCFALFCGYSVYFLSTNSTISLSAALLICFIFGLSPPVYFYTNFAYPEIIAGTLLALLSLFFLYQKKIYFLPFIFAAIAIWFTDRVILPTLIICAGGFFTLPTKKQKTTAIIILGISGLIFALYCWHRFGVPFPKIHNTTPGFVFSYEKVPQRIFQILFDARQGWVWLFPPVLLIPAMLWQIVKNKNMTLNHICLVSALVISLLLIAAYDDYGAGTCPRGRYFVIPQFIFWILAMVWLQDKKGRKFKMIWLVGLGSISLMQLYWLAPNPKWWFANFHPFFSWESIHLLIFKLPFLPDNAEYSEWLKLIKMSPLLALPSLSFILFERLAGNGAAK